MKMVKRLTVMLAMSALAASLTGCASGDEDTTATTTAQTLSTTAITTTTQHGVMTASELIVRDGPGMDYDSIGGVSYGEDIVILGREGDWFKIQFGDGVGYISAHYVDVDGEPNASEMVASRTTVSAASAAATTVATAADGTPITQAASATTISTGVGTVTATTQAGTVPTTEDGIPLTSEEDAFN